MASHEVMSYKYELYIHCEMSAPPSDRKSRHTWSVLQTLCQPTKCSLGNFKMQTWKRDARNPYGMSWRESLSPLGSRLPEAVLVSELALPPLVQRSPRTPFCYSQTAHSLAKKCWESIGCSGSHPDGSPMAGGLPGPLWQHAATHLTALTRCHRPSPKEPFTTMEATPLPKL